MERSGRVGQAIALLFILGFVGLAVFIITADESTIRRTVNELRGEISCEDGVQFDDTNAPAAYQQIVRDDVQAIEQFWRNAYPEQWGDDFRSPCVILEYEVQTFEYADSCGLLNNEQAAQNAFYCGGVESIFWDGPTFIQPIFEDVGRSAMTIIVAHEYGHYVQDISNSYPDEPFNVEMQADCYAGAFLGNALENGILGISDIDEIIRIMASFGQPRWTGLWTERSYGSSVQRNLAIRQGQQEGVQGCFIDFAEAYNFDGRGFGNR